MALFWLSDEVWIATETRLPKNQLGVWRFNDQLVISGIPCAQDWPPMVRLSCRMRSSTTIYNRWSRRGSWLKLPEALLDANVVATNSVVDGTYIKTQHIHSMENCQD
jgi:hypothetical protein